MGVTAREVIFRIIGDTDSLVKGYDQAGKAQEEFEKKAKAANKILGDIAKTSGFVVTAVAGIGIALGKMALDFSQDFSQVETLIPGATARILELKKNVQDLSVEQGRFSKDLIGGLYETISTYGDTADSAAVLALSSKSAVAGNSTTIESLHLLSAVTKAYGDTSLEAQKQVADLAFQTVKLGVTTIPELGRNIQDVSPLAKQLGVSLEEMFNIFATGTGVVGNTSEVATKFKDALVGMMKPNVDLLALYKQMAVANGEALVSQNGFIGGLNRIKTAAEQAGIPFGNLFDSNQAVLLALSLTGAQAKTAAIFLDQLKDSSGSLDQAYVAATTGLNKYGFELSQTQQAATLFGQRLGDQVLKSTQDLLGPIADLTRGLASIDDETLANIVSVGKVVVVAATAAGGIALFSRAVIGAGAAWRLLTGVMAANPIGLAIVGVVTAVSVLNELTKASENATLASIKNAQAMQDQKAKGLELAAQYEVLKNKTGKTFEEQERLFRIMADLKTLYPELTDKIITQAVEQGKLKDLIVQTNQARNAPALKNLNDDKKRLEDEVNGLQSEQSALAKKTQDLQSRAEQAKKIDPWTILSQSAALARKDQLAVEKAIDGKLTQLRALQDKINELTGANTPVEVPSAPDPNASGTAGLGKGVDPTSQGGRLLAFENAYKAERDRAEKQGDDLLAIDRAHLEKRQDLLASFVDEDIKLQKTNEQSLASKLSGWNGATIGQLQKETRAQLQALAADPSNTVAFQANLRFQTEQGVSVEDALKTIRDEANKTADDALKAIQAQARQEVDLRTKLEATNLTTADRANLEQYLAQTVQRQIDLSVTRAGALHVEAAASDQLLSIDLDRISKTASQTQASIDREIALKKELGLLGDNAVEVANNERKLRANTLQEKQNSLAAEYTSLMASSKDETNKAADADRQKAEATKAQFKQIAKELMGLNDEIEKEAEASPLETKFKALAASWDSLFTDGKDKWKNFFKSLGEFAQVAADQIKTSFDGVKAIATGLISNDAERKAQESNAKLTQVERDKNDALAALDDELTAMKKAHAEENQAIAEAQAEAEYQAKQAEYDQSITDLQTALDQETNMAKAKDLEKQLEAARKTKREAQEAKAKEKEDKARAKKQTEEENAILNQRATQEWQYNTTKVEIENAAGVASANAAKEKAKWDKASTVLSLTLLATKELAEAAAAGARFDPVGASLHGLAAGLAGAQAGVAGSAPEPASYSPQPLPPPPVFLAAGAIFLPQPGGTDIVTSGGTRATVAEARVPEIYLPLTGPNLQSLFQAAGISTNQGGEGFYYAPVFTLQFAQNDGTTKEEVFDYLKNDVSRDLMEIVMDAKRKFYVGN